MVSRQAAVFTLGLAVITANLSIIRGKECILAAGCQATYVLSFVGRDHRPVAACRRAELVTDHSFQATRRIGPLKVELFNGDMKRSY